uniref:Uncharacterized protein n=1 Tax=Opuntia streptacantha TaxID=393608 RepID=A0A7C9AYG4_OPUST
MLPVRLLYERSTTLIEGRVEISQGIIPVNKFCLKFRLISFTQCPISQGIGPFKKLPSISIWYKLSHPLKSGIFPEIPLKDAENTCKLDDPHIPSGNSDPE